MTQFTGTAAPDHIIGSASADVISGRGGNDILEGGAGNDRITGGLGADTIYGGDGADTLSGGRGSDMLYGGRGNDMFLFASGDGKDVIGDFSSGDLVKISGFTSAQSVNQVGADVVVTLSATDKITFSGASVSTVQAALQFGTGSGDGGGGTLGTTITGTNGNDVLNGTTGDDVIMGLGGYDVINGGAGNDRIYGGASGDNLTGGAGADVFVYTSTAEGPPYGLMYYEFDTITDWQSIDKIDLSAIDLNPALAGQQSFHFAGIGAGGLDVPDHSPGALYINKLDGYVWISGYVDGDVYPDFDIEIYGPDALSLSASNLIL